MFKKLGEAKDLIVFFKKDKIYLIPIILLLVIIGLLIMLASASPVTVFLYPLI